MKTRTIEVTQILCDEMLSGESLCKEWYLQREIDKQNNGSDDLLFIPVG